MLFLIQSLAPLKNRNILVLFTTYAISWCVMALAFSATASVGYQLAENPAWSLLPLIMQVFGALAMTIPAAKMMAVFGRRKGFMFGSLIGMVGALMCAFSIYQQSFWLLVCSTPFLGMFNGFGEFARFAAAEIYPDEKRKSRAIAIVVSGGIVSAFLGPAIADGSNRYFENIAPYFGPYLAALVLCSISLGCYFWLKDIRDSETKAESASHSTITRAQILSDPIFIVATSSAAIGYLVMAAMMDAMPITMLEHHLSFSQTTVVLQWHMLAMFAPSFLTSRLIQRFGVSWVIYGGILLNAIGLISALQGVQMHHFWTGLFLIGLGWNFMYLGGTQLLARVSATNKRQTEGLNNFAIMSSFAISAPLAAFILNYFGWEAVNYFALGLLLLALTLIVKHKSCLVAN